LYVSVENMIVNGIDLSQRFKTDKGYFIVNDVRGRGIMSEDIQLLTIPGMAGAYIDEENTPERILEVDFSLKGESFEELRKKIEELSAILRTGRVSISFNDESDREYFGQLGRVEHRIEKSCIYQGTLYFVCPDPHKYGPEKMIENPSNFLVEGSVETYPTIKVEVKQDTTFVAVSDGERINLIGNPTEVEQTPYERETRVLWDQLGALTGWTTSTSVEEGTNAGAITTNGYEFSASSYGTGTAWHGPALKKSIGQTIQDFRVDVLLQQIGSAGQLGGVEIALLDASSQFTAKLQMFKRSTGSGANTARLRAGKYDNGHDIINEYGDQWWVWQNFDGILRIERVGNVWTAYVARIDKGVFNTTRLRTWTDSEGVAAAPITQVQVQLWQHGSTPATNQRIKDIKVFRINQQSSGIPYVARVGDVIEFDHQVDIIRKNGEDITKEKAFIGEYFPLKTGMNTLVVEPAEAIEKAEVRWRPKWL
jgi:predicted phage tail component-like protein